jgi:hypothetical protein
VEKRKKTTKTLVSFAKHHHFSGRRNLVHNIRSKNKYIVKSLIQALFRILTDYVSTQAKQGLCRSIVGATGPGQSILSALFWRAAKLATV